MEFDLFPRQTGGGTVIKNNSLWRLDIPAGSSRSYRLAQLDDYAHTARSRFKNLTPFTLRLRARLSRADLPGTWGFGLWNDPFGLSIGFGGETARLPALPQTAWFMYASPPNWLSLQDARSQTLDKTIPANGFLAGTFTSPHISSFLFLPGLLALPLILVTPISRLLRRLARRFIRQDAVRVVLDVTQWHDYSIDWKSDVCTFKTDGNQILSTTWSPRSPLGLVIWIDNQFAAWDPKGHLAYGTLETPSASLELENLSS
jgi:hypothetical protein